MKKSKMFTNISNPRGLPGQGSGVRGGAQKGQLDRGAQVGGLKSPSSRLTTVLKWQLQGPSPKQAEVRIWVLSKTKETFSYMPLLPGGTATHYSLSVGQ